jgi:hypothetical protein
VSYALWWTPHSPTPHPPCSASPRQRPYASGPRGQPPGVRGARCRCRPRHRVGARRPSRCACPALGAFQATAIVGSSRCEAPDERPMHLRCIQPAAPNQIEHLPPSVPGFQPAAAVPRPVYWPHRRGSSSHDARGGASADGVWLMATQRTVTLDDIKSQVSKTEPKGAVGGRDAPRPPRSSCS